MKKILALFIALVFCFSSFVVYADTNSEYDCSDWAKENVDGPFEISYYNSGNCGEFDSPLRMGYYTYSTSDKVEIEKIQNCIAEMDFVPFNGGFAGGSGESLTVRTGDGKEIYFYLGSDFDGKWLCYYDGKCYSFSIEKCRELEELVLEFKSKDELKVYLNNKMIKLYNDPVIVNDRTLVPAANIAEALGLKVSGGEESISFTKDDIVCTFLPGENTIIENSRQKSIDAGCQIIDRIAMVPIRALAECYGFEVKWENNSVYIVSE